LVIDTERFQRYGGTVQVFCFYSKKQAGVREFLHFCFEPLGFFSGDFYGKHTDKLWEFSRELKLITLTRRHGDVFFEAIF